ncbi:larval/pupal cuticle protein H1C-like [Aethina tumida]|uniref:larval/pupal cuticle protein H1C-like n=1 Tax=Aethina tumida TaxID=116153 RepID=UPI002147A193|nr:larval/pupal cuticle protein H1C-like [Aethina tumida]
MAFKFVVFAAALAYANAGLLSAPAVATYAAAPAVAHYSSAPAVSSSYIHQASAPVAVAHAAPVVSAYSAPLAHAAPVVSAYSSPVAVAHASPVAIHAPAIGSSQQSVVRGLGGAQAISTYSKAVDSAFSSVRKYDTRITNDALSVAHSPVAVAHAAPLAVAHAPVAVSHSAPLVTKTAAVAYSPAAVVSHATFSGLGVNYGW